MRSACADTLEASLTASNSPRREHLSYNIVKLQMMLFYRTCSKPDFDEPQTRRIVAQQNDLDEGSIVGVQAD